MGDGTSSSDSRGFEPWEHWWQILQEGPTLLVILGILAKTVLMAGLLLLLLVVGGFWFGTAAVAAPWAQLLGFPVEGEWFSSLLWALLALQALGVWLGFRAQMGRARKGTAWVLGSQIQDLSLSMKQIRTLGSGYMPLRSITRIGRHFLRFQKPAGGVDDHGDPLWNPEALNQAHRRLDARFPIHAVTIGGLILSSWVYLALGFLGLEGLLSGLL